MKVLLYRLAELIFGYCAKHHRYGRPCMGCTIDDHLNHPALRPTQERE